MGIGLYQFFLSKLRNQPNGSTKPTCFKGCCVWIRDLKGRKSTARDNQWLNLKNPSQADPEESIQAIFMFSRGSDIIMRKTEIWADNVGFFWGYFSSRKIKDNAQLFSLYWKTEKPRVDRINCSDWKNEMIRFQRLSLWGRNRLKLSKCPD